MSTENTPQIYLITPSVIDLDEFEPKLARLLDSFEIACIRLALSSNDESVITKSADRLRETAHSREIAIVINDHHRLVTPLGLDGVHLSDGARNLRDIRKTLGQDAIIGAHCGTSKHAGVTAGEIGADYVCFGPIGESALGDGTRASPDLFAWWSEMVELPVVAEGNLDLSSIKSLANVVDWFALGDEIWNHPEGEIEAMKAINTCLSANG